MKKKMGLSVPVTLSLLLVFVSPKYNEDFVQLRWSEGNSTVAWRSVSGGPGQQRRSLCYPQHSQLLMDEQAPAFHSEDAHAHTHTNWC